MPPSRRPNFRFGGIALMAAGFFMFSAADTLAKLLTEYYHPLQIAWTRQLGLVFGVVVLLVLRGPVILNTIRPGIQIARGALASISAALFITAVAFVPLADAVAVSFVAPFMVTILGALILKEKVGIRRWLAVMIGFIGALIVVRPGMGVIHPAAMLVVVAAAAFALRQIASRSLGSADSTATTVAYTAITSTVLLSLPLAFVWSTPQLGSHVMIMAVMALLASTGEVLIIRSLELAEAVVLAPIHYSLLIWGTFYGWLVFDQLPDGFTWLGATIIIATGLYTLHRERVVASDR